MAAPTPRRHLESLPLAFVLGLATLAPQTATAEPSLVRDDAISRNRDSIVEVELGELLAAIPAGATLPANWVHLRYFLRGDANADGVLSMEDALDGLATHFGGQDDVRCWDAADFNDSGEYYLDDTVGLLGFLFLGGPPAPGAGPYELQTDNATPDGLGCAVPAKITVLVPYAEIPEEWRSASIPLPTPAPGPVPVQDSSPGPKKVPVKPRPQPLPQPIPAPSTLAPVGPLTTPILRALGK
jgi:hypothetical protein